MSKYVFEKAAEYVMKSMPRLIFQYWKRPMAYRHHGRTIQKKKKKKERNEQIHGKHENVSIVFQFNARLDIVYTLFHSPTSLHKGL